MKKTFFVAAAIIFSSRLLAQDSTIKVLDEAVVTANKFEQKQSTTGKVITVITKEQIEKSAGKTVAQLLNDQAGISIASAYNALGSVQTVFMRGANAGRALILMDGIPVNDPSMITNDFDLNLISINEVERIEICKGAQSTLYGSDAIGGVINIITVKKDINKAFNVKATTSLGNKNTTRNNVQLFGKVKKLTYTTRFARLTTDGFSAAYDQSGKNRFEKDGYKGNTVSAALQYQFLPELSARAFVQHTEYRGDVDNGVFVDDRDYTIHNSSLFTGAGLNYKKGIVSITANYQHGELKRRYLNDSFYVSGFSKYESNKYNGRTQYAEVYGNVKATKWLTVLLGSDYRWANMNQHYLSISSFGPYATTFSDSFYHQTAVYGSLFFNALKQRLNIEVGGRLNDHSRYGKNYTYTFNPSFSITKNWRVFGSVASSFKAPSIFQLFDKSNGNLGLKAERSVNYEGGIQAQYAAINARVVYFHRNVKNGVDFDYINYVYYNFVKQNVNGLEVEVAAHPVKGFDITANYALIDGKETTQSRITVNDTTYKYLLRRPKNSFNITLGYQFTPALYISVNGKAVSERHDVGGYQVPDVVLKGYFLLGAYAEYKLNDHVKFFADAQNLTDKKFFDIRGFTAIPLLVNGGISLNW